MPKLISRLILGLALASLVGSAQFVAPGRVNRLLTVVTSGTPVEVTTNRNLIADRLLIQAPLGATVGVGYICVVPVGTTPHSKCSTAGELGGEIAAATSTAPGGSYSDTSPTTQTPGIQMATIWLDSDTSGTPYIISYNVR